MTLAGFARGRRINVYAPETSTAAWRSRTSSRVGTGRPGSACARTGSAAERRSPTTTSRSPRWRGPTGATRSTRGTSSPRAPATGARSASPGSTTGRSTASTCARPGCGCSRSTRPTRSTPSSLSDVAAAAEPHRRASCARSAGSAIPMRRRRGDAGFHRISGTRRSTRSAGAITATDARPGRDLPHQPGPHQRDLLRRRQGGPGDGDRQRRQRRPGLPRPVDPRDCKATVGVAATTCSYVDLIESDLVVLWGANPANNQPVLMKYLYLAKKRGCRVVVVNPYLEPGLERYWVPSNVESALFGTKMCDLHVPVRPGGDVAFANAALKLLIERGAGRQGVHRRAHRGLGRRWSPPSKARTSTSLLDRWPGSPGRRSRPSSTSTPRRARPCSSGRWASPSTAARSTPCGRSSTWRLARGNVGRDGAGLMPIRGHSGVQGGAEMGAYSTALPGGPPGRRGQRGRDRPELGLRRAAASRGSPLRR